MLKLLLELGPIVVFFATYKQSDIFSATFSMVVVTVVSLIISYMVDKKISMPLLISGGILFISGGFTLLSGDASYIKMKPTLVYMIFASILTFGIVKQKPFAKTIFGHAFSMEEIYWMILSRRFAFYFFMMALVNEIVWRNFSEEIWVNFKIFGAVPLTLIFIIFQVPFLHKHATKK